MKIARGIGLFVFALMLAACGDEWLEEEETSKVQVETASTQTEDAANYVDEEIEMVDLVGDGCKEGEVYIEEDDVCSLVVECDDPEGCVEWGDELVWMLEEEYGSLIYEESVPEPFDGLDTIAVYDVDLETEELYTDANIDDETLEYHAGLWYSYAWIIPEHARPEMDRFEVFQSGDSLAHVYIHDETAASQWTLGINNEHQEYASESMVTYIHEFAHLLSLRETEVDYYSDVCETYLIEEDCYFDDAYIADFYHQFYADGKAEYTEDDYVTEYAETTIVEDFAETFAHFVLTAYPAGDTLAEEKIQFFYQYENLIELRAEILGRAATWMDRIVVE
ncbi:hypothetical protein [Lysinibacillus sp. LZ02]|uniref:hypothetical protein n=1 Tax=Lysinibacillus sp. LZ02 TaxID=3420668 RepID=UPI003D35F92A